MLPRLLFYKPNNAQCVKCKEMQKKSDSSKLATACSVSISGKIKEVSHCLVEGEKEGDLVMTPKS